MGPKSSTQGFNIFKNFTLAREKLNQMKKQKVDMVKQMKEEAKQAREKEKEVKKSCPTLENRKAMYLIVIYIVSLF